VSRPAAPAGGPAPGGGPGPGAGRGADVRRGLGLAEGVLGAGLLVLPPVVAGVAGSAAPAAWVVQLLLGASVAALLGSLAARRGVPGGLQDLIGAVLGPAARRTVVAAFLVGFTVGQAALALAAGRLLVTALGVSWSPLWAGAAVLALGAAGARVPWSVRGRRVRLAVALAVALAACTWPAVYATSGLLAPPGGDRWVVAVFLLFFAGVGWESAGRATGGGRVLPATAVALAAVGLVQLTLAVVLDVRSGTIDAPANWSLRAIMMCGSVTLLAYVGTNLAAAGRFATELKPSIGRTAPLVLAVAAAAAMVGADALGWGVTALLFVPCLAAWVGHLLGCVAAARGGDHFLIAPAIILAVFLAALLIMTVIDSGSGSGISPGNV
jgi:amino acid efflux transporter